MAEPLPDTTFESPTDPQSSPTASVRLPAPRDEAAPRPPGGDPAPSGKAGRNLLFDEIARGGMGAVLRGRDPELGRDLAADHESGQRYTHCANRRSMSSRSKGEFVFCRAASRYWRARAGSPARR
jgi:hypothetical protein